MSQYNTSQTPLPAPLPAADELSTRVARHGQQVGPYTLRALLSEGPTGALFHADRHDGRAAMVRLLPRALGSLDTVELFFEQQRLLAETGSPHLVAPLDWGQSDEVFYIAAPALIGCDLQMALAAKGGVHRRKALEIARQVCVGLEVAHRAGLVHGSLSPQNVYLAATGTEITVKVLDFGAYALAARPHSLVILGDPAYLAPEQFAGQTTARSDIYSLALIVYELLTGQRFCEGSAATATAQKLTSEAPTGRLDPTLSALLGRSLDRDPAQRPPSVEAFRRSLLAWAERSPALLDSTEALHLSIAASIQPQNSVQSVRNPSTGVQVNFGQPMERPTMQSNGKNKLEAAPPASGVGGGKPPSESDSVEASLEEFINQANASFPTSDGWDLHTGDVELVDEPSVEDDDDDLATAESEATSVTTATELERQQRSAARASDELDLDAPRRPGAAGKPGSRPTQSLGSGVTAAATAAAATTPAPTGPTKTTSKAMPAVAEEAPPKKSTSKAMPAVAAPAESELPPTPKRSTSKSMPVAAEPEETPLPKRPSRSMPTAERTEVVAQPLPAPMQAAPPAWTSNPLVLAACMTLAFVVGAGALYLMTRNLQQQPIVVQAPPAPVAAPAPAAAPVVTPLPAAAPAAAAPAPAATAPVVTPLPTEAPKPAEAAPAAAAEPAAATDEDQKVAAIRQKLAQKSEKAAKAKPEKAASAPKAAKAEKAEKAEKPAAAPKAKAEAKSAKAASEDKPAPAKKETKAKSGGGDWVDPF